MRRAAFTRPEPGFSLYEGRTRGKRMRYTYDDEDGSMSDGTSTRRSNRQSTRSTPFETGPTYTASGRQIKQPRTGDYGESLLSHGAENATDELSPDYRNGLPQSGEDDSEPVRPSGRDTRSAGRREVNGAVNGRKRKHIDGYNSIDDMSEEDDAAPSGDEWNSDKNDGADDEMPDADDEKDEPSEDEEVDDDEEDDGPQSLVLRLRVPREALLKCNGAPVEARGQHTIEAEQKAPPPILPKPAEASTGAGAPKIEPAKLPMHNGLTNGYQAAPSPLSAVTYPTPVTVTTEMEN